MTAVNNKLYRLLNLLNLFNSKLSGYLVAFPINQNNLQKTIIIKIEIKNKKKKKKSQSNSRELAFASGYAKKISQRAWDQHGVRLPAQLLLTHANMISPGVSGV